jgi:hypothetical protein
MMNNQEQLVERLTRFYRETRGEVRSTPPLWVPGKPPTMRWLQPVLASVALIAVAAGLAVTVRIVREQAQRKTTPPPIVSPAPAPSPSSSATPSPSPSPSPTPSWVTRRVALGQVQAMSLDATAIFALYAPNPLSGGIDASRMRLARVDRSSGAVTSAGPFPNAWHLAGTASGLWIAAGADQSATAADTQWLTLLDPVTLKVKQRIHLPGQPTAGTYPVPQLAASLDLLWLAYGGSLYRLDPATGRVLLTQNLAGTATGLSIDPSSRRLYAGVVPNKGTTALVIEWDGSTGRLIASAPTGGVDLGGPAVIAAPDGVWIAYATGMMGAVEHRADTSLAVLAGPLHGHSNGIRAFVGGGALWLADGGAGQVECADLRTGTTAASSQENLASVIVADANGSYLGDADGVGFLRPDPACPH